jgi:hypothetical protein
MIEGVISMTAVELVNLPEVVTVSREELVVLVQSLVRVEVAAQLEGLGGKRVARASRFVRPDKLYAGLKGHYFVLKLGELMGVEDPGLLEMVERVLAVVQSDSVFPQESALARAIRMHAASKGEVVMWAPNQEYLIVGNHRNGEKGRDELEKFRIEQRWLEDLGDFSPNNEMGVAVGLLAVKERIGFDEFVRAEMESKAQEKAGEKLRKLGGRG